MTASASITLRYDAYEDRLLVAIDAASSKALAFWLTRRLALRFIESANPSLDRISPVAINTPAELRGEVATMEREVALALTEKAVSQTPDTALETVSALAELAVELGIFVEPRGLRLKFRGRTGAEAAVGCSRAELQRILHMLEQEAVKAGWREPAPVAARPTDGRQANRRAN